MALSHATSEAIYMTSLVEELGYQQDTVPIFADNEAAIAITAEPADIMTKSLPLQNHKRLRGTLCGGDLDQRPVQIGRAHV